MHTIQGDEKCNAYESIAMRDRLKRLKQENDAVILAHNYQRDEVQDAADHVGDSFELAKIASEITCAVIRVLWSRFHGRKTRPSSHRKAGAAAREGGDVPDVAHDHPKTTCDQLKKRYPGAPVVCYVNTSAAVKAESDVCCTSANAVKIVNAP